MAHCGPITFEFSLLVLRARGSCVASWPAETDSPLICLRDLFFIDVHRPCADTWETHGV
jgi:hypothetical protein